MLDRFLEYLNTIHPPKPNHVFLLAVSGGVDSVVLTHLFASAKIPFAIAHCNFQLREEESTGDMEFVKNIANSLQVPFHCEIFDTKKAQQNSGESTQMIARKLRYTWFDTLLEQYKYKKLVTAHHLNDNIETVLLNITRGTSVKGLTGIAPVSEKLLRPLLFATKAEIESYATQNGLSWREDSSNQSDKYKRNLVRHHAIDLFEQLNPNFLHTFSANIERWKLLSTHIDAAVQTIGKQHEVANGWQFDKAFLVESSNHFIFFEWLKNIGFNENQFKEMMLVSHSGKQWETENHIAIFSQNQLFVTLKSSEKLVDKIITESDTTIKLTKGVLILSSSSTKENLPHPQNVALLDCDKLKFPLQLRTWQLGDKFRPMGMKGKKKISDFLVDVKIPLPLKKEVLVLLSEGKIVWLVNHRISESHKITPETKRILRIDFQPIFPSTHNLDPSQ